MRNEILLIASLFVIYGMVLLWYCLFGKKGLYCWTVLATIAANIEVMILVDAFGMEQTLGNILFASTFLLAFIIYQVTRRNLLPALGEYAGHIRFNGYKQLSRKERRAMIGNK